MSDPTPPANPPYVYAPAPQAWEQGLDWWDIEKEYKAREMEQKEVHDSEDC